MAQIINRDSCKLLFMGGLFLETMKCCWYIINKVSAIGSISVELNYEES